MRTSHGVDFSERDVLQEPRLQHDSKSEVKAIVRPRINGPPRVHSATRIRIHATRAKHQILGEDRRTQSYPPNVFSDRGDEAMIRPVSSGEEPLSPILSDEEVGFLQAHKRVKGRSRSANTYRNGCFHDQKGLPALSALSTSLATEINTTLQLRHDELKRSIREVMSEHNASFKLEYAELRDSIERATLIFQCLPASQIGLRPCGSEEKDDRWSEPEQPSPQQSQHSLSSLQPPQPPETPPAELPGAVLMENGASENGEDTIDSLSAGPKRAQSKRSTMMISETPNSTRVTLKRKVSAAGKFALEESGIDARLLYLLQHIVPTLGPADMVRLRSTILWKFTHSARFQWLSAMLIFGYTIFIGISSDQELRSEIAKHKTGKEIYYTEIAFLGWFTLELVLRLLAERKHFFLGEEWKFNFLDAILVGVSAVGFILDPSGRGSASKASVARIFRLFRFIRVLRIVRVIRSFQSLRILAFSIIESFTSLFWCFVVVVAVIYLFAIFILSGVTEYYRAPTEGVDSTELSRYWGGLIIAMVSLFKAISGGMDWEDLLSPLRDVDWIYEPIFVFYTFFMLLGVLNVVVATFVETTAQVARNDKDANVKAELSRVKDYWKNINKFFSQADDDNSGSLTWPEFEAYLGNDEVKAYFQTLELDVSEAHVLFKLLAGDDEEVSIEEFCDGCMRLKGKARSIDVNLLIYQTEKTMDMVTEGLEKSRALSEAVAERLGITVAPPAPLAPSKSLRRSCMPAHPPLAEEQLLA